MFQVLYFFILDTPFCCTKLVSPPLEENLSWSFVRAKKKKLMESSQKYWKVIESIQDVHVTLGINFISIIINSLENSEWPILIHAILQDKGCFSIFKFSTLTKTLEAIFSLSIITLHTSVSTVNWVQNNIFHWGSSFSLGMALFMRCRVWESSCSFFLFFFLFHF